MTIAGITATIDLNGQTLFNYAGAIGFGTLLTLILLIGRKVFEFGKIMQRLDDVEKDIKEVKKEVRSVAKRIDELTIAIIQHQPYK